MEVYIALMWYYEGDSNLVDSFIGVYKSREEAEDNIKDILGDRELNLVSFINYETGEESDIYKEGFYAKEFGSYNSNPKFEIRKYIL